MLAYFQKATYKIYFEIVFKKLKQVIILLQDQIDQLQSKNIIADTINSKMSTGERQRVINDLRCMKPSIRLLYVTPEQAATNTFKVSILRILKNIIN